MFVSLFSVKLDCASFEYIDGIYIVLGSKGVKKQ